MTIKKRLHRSNIYMFLIPLVTAALLLILGAGIAIYILEVKYLPQIGLSLHDMHIAVEQYEGLFQSFETFVWIYVGAVGMALLLTIVFTNVSLTRELFTHISDPLDTLVAGVDRIRSGDLDNPINYTEPDEFKAACDAVDLMAAKLKASLEADQRRQQSSRELMAGMGHDLKSPLTSIRAYTEALLEGVADTPEMQKKYLETIKKKGGEIEFYQCDVTKEDQVVDFFRKVEERFGKIDILVNNAGATGPGENPDEITTEGYDMVMDLDARGSFICAKHVIQYFRKIGGGNIINMASICALKAEVPGLAPYHIAKAAVLMMSKVFAMSYAKENIRCNSICPGTTATPLIVEYGTRMCGSFEAYQDEVGPLHPMGNGSQQKLGEPIDVAMAAVYLASDEAKWVTGAQISVDGGWSVT